MKSALKFSLAGLICSVPLSAMAVDWSSVPTRHEDRYRYQKSIDKHMKNVDSSMDYYIKLFKRYGLYLGFDLDVDPVKRVITLLNPDKTQINQVYSYNSLFGATPVMGSNNQQKLPYFLPENNPLAQTLNPWGNYIYKNPPYSSTSTSSNQGNVTVSILMDQKPYQDDPVSQAVLDIIATPDYSYCLDYWGTTYNQDCKYLTNDAVKSQIIGTLPGTFDYMTGNYTKNLITMLNGNNLLAPLLYSTENIRTNNSGTNQQDQGLTANSQAQLANNFIRYVSGQVSPPTLPNLRIYDQLYNVATTKQKNISIEMRKAAQATLSSYFTNLRVFTARSSAGMSNLYYLMSKRMPQDFKTGRSGSGSKTSQALEEFKMASWRLYDPEQANKQGSDGQGQSQWLNQIDQASPLTIQKEIAVLLAEINYQLYLNRQQQERILLANTLTMMLQNEVSPPRLTDQAETAATTPPPGS